MNFDINESNKDDAVMFQSINVMEFFLFEDQLFYRFNPGQEIDSANAVSIQRGELVYFNPKMSVTKLKKVTLTVQK